jgi:hypothetical protein
LILLSGQSHLVNLLENKKRLAIGNRQGLASTLLSLLKDGNYSQAGNPLHSSINCDSVLKLVDQIGTYQTVGLK